MTIEKQSWFRLALQLRGSVIPAIIPRILLCSGFGFLISLIYHLGWIIPAEIFGSVIGNVAFNLVLGLLLVFRTNTAYDRYWEGRKVWGGITINILNLARKISISVAATSPGDRENKKSALNLLAAFAIATKLHLRNEAVNTELKSLLTPEQYYKLQDARNKPLQVAYWINEYLKKEQLQKRLSIYEFLVMSKSVDGMVEACIGSDRILKTPIPLAYTIYLKRLLLIYCFFLPFQVVKNVHWWTTFVVAVISFILFGVEEIGNEIEDPFGRDANDLPLDDICNNLVNNLEDLTAQ